MAKNYLTETELEDLGRIVNAYLELAEGRAKRRVPMTMEEWAKRLDIFLSADEREVLQDAGTVAAPLCWGVLRLPEHGNRVPWLQSATFGDAPSRR